MERTNGVSVINLRCLDMFEKGCDDRNSEWNLDLCFLKNS